MKIKRMLMGAVCCLAFEGAFAQSPGSSATKQGNATCCSGCASVSTQKYGSSSAKQLLNRLRLLQDQGIMVGHQDDPVYGTTWKWDEGKSDVLLTTGDYPAVMGFDLGKLEQDSKENLDGVPFDRMRQEIIAQFKRGGIITLSWHPWNPVTGENAWDPKGDAVNAILEGGAQQKKFESWLKKIADFINSLQTCCGKKVPVIFRPWLEMNGGWFWWGANSCTPEQYKMLYIKTYVTLMKAGCDNIVWAWSPNLSDKKDVDSFLKCYPGGDFVDLIGVDIYEFDDSDVNYQKNLVETLDVMKLAAEKVGKMAALTETGCRGISKKKDWFTKTLWPVLQHYQLSYVLFWRNAWDKPQEEAYLPGVKDGAIVKDFKNFYNESKVLFVKEVVGNE